MSFDNKSTDELIRLAKAGLGFSLSADCKSADDLRAIIDAAAEGGASISFVGVAGANQAVTSLNQPNAEPEKSG
jgi:hypothetical protein